MPGAPLLLAFTCSLLLAGCVEETASTVPEPPASPPPIPPSNPAPPPAAIVNIPGLELNECQAMAGAVNVASTGGGLHAPPGWELDTIYGTIGMEPIHCERLASGALERKDVGLLIEWHDYLDVPDSCLEFDAPDYVVALHRLWGDDETTAQDLAARFGMPTGLIQLDSGFERQPSPGLVSWEWGNGTSRLETGILQDTDSPLGNGIPTTIRFAWYNGTTLGLWDLTYDMMGYSNRTVVGRISTASPMAAAELGYGEAVGRVETFTRGDLPGKIHLFRDTQCKDPIV